MYSCLLKLFFPFTTLTHNSVFGACLLAPLYVQLLFLSNWVSVSEPEVIYLCYWVLPVHLNGEFCLAKYSDIINSRDFWEGYKDNTVELGVQSLKLKGLHLSCGNHRCSAPTCPWARWWIPNTLKCDLVGRGSSRNFPFGHLEDIKNQTWHQSNCKLYSLLLKLYSL